MRKLFQISTRENEFTALNTLKAPLIAVQNGI